MSGNISAVDARIIAGAALGSITGPDGATDEQLTILRTIAGHVWGVDDLDLSPGAALSATDAALMLSDPMLRRRARELMVLLEMCRHPLEAAHAQRVEDYCHALGGDGPGIELIRDFMSSGADAAVADWMRRYEPLAPATMEPEMIELAAADEATAGARFEEIEGALRAAAPGTLGAAFIDFYDRNGFTIGPESIPLFGHDMAHVIGGYDATPIGEICIGAMKVMVTDSDAHWIEFLGNVMIHETGILLPGYEPHEPALKDDERIEMMVTAMDRGRRTERDFSVGEHMSMIDWKYEDVLEHYGVPPL